MKIGLIRERKQPEDLRAPLTPMQCVQLMKNNPSIEVVVEPSSIRCFSDNDYEIAGVPVQTDLSDCDVLLGVKEVPEEDLIAGKTYMFFSHTIKAQEYNRGLLQTVLKKQIRLIDYETLVWPKDGMRILGFGKWAGIVGTYNALLTWGRKQNLFELPPAHEVRDFDRCMELLKAVDLGEARIVYTGNGRVASGIREVLETIGVEEVSPSEFIMMPDRAPAFTQLTNWDLYHRADGGEWEMQHFYTHHKEYCCEFSQYTMAADILINGMYWEKDMPALFTKEETARDDFKIQVIADITCDVEGSVPITMEATSIYNPSFGWSRSLQKQVPAYGEDTIDVMAVTNLPTELPKDASHAFGEALVEHILPLFVTGDEEEILHKASLTTLEGSLTSDYSYLQDFVDGK